MYLWAGGWLSSPWKPQNSPKSSPAPPWRLHAASHQWYVCGLTMWQSCASVFFLEPNTQLTRKWSGFMLIFSLATTDSESQCNTQTLNHGQSSSHERMPAFRMKKAAYRVSMSHPKWLGARLIEEQGLAAGRAESTWPRQRAHDHDTATQRKSVLFSK